MPEHPRLRRFARTAAVAAGVTLAVLVAGWMLLRSDRAKGWALQQATAILARQGIGFSAKSLELDLKGLRATARGVTFRTAGGVGGEPFASADSIEAKVALFDGRLLSIRQVVVDGLRLRIVIDSAGKSNLPVLKPRDPNAKPFEFGELQLRNASIYFSDARQPAVLDLTGIGAAVKQSGGRYPIEMSTASPGSLTFRGVNQTVTSVQTKLVFDEKLTGIDAFRMVAGDWSLDAQGTVEELERLKIRIQAGGSNRLVARLAGLAQDVQGTHRADVSVSGPVANPLINGKLSLTGTWFDGQGPFDGASQLRWDTAQQRGSLSGMDLRWGATGMQGSGEFTTASGARNSINLRFQNLSSAQVARVAAIEIPAAANVSGTVAMSFPLPVSMAAVDGVANVHLTGSPAKNKVPVSGDAVIRMRRGTTELTVQSLRAAQASAEGSMVLNERSELAGALKIGAADLDKTLAELRQAGIRLDSITPGTVTGPLQVDAALSGTLESPSAQLNITSDRVVLRPVAKGGALAGALRGAAFASRDRVIVQDLRFEQAPASFLLARGEWSNGSLSFSGELRHASLKSLIQVADASADPATLPEGSIAADFRIDGTASKPVVTAGVQSSGLALMQQPLGAFRADLRYEEDRLSVPEFRLARGTGSISGQGAWNSRTGAISVDARANRFVIDSMRLPDGSPMRMILDGSVASGGTVDRPEVKFEVAANGVGFRDIQAGRVAMNGTLTGKLLAAAIEAPGFGLNAKLEGPIDSSARSTLDLNLSQTPVEALVSSVAGRVDASARATFLWSDPVKTAQAGGMLKSARLKMLDPKTAAIGELRVDSPALARFDGRYFSFDPVTILAGAQSSAIVSGRVPVDAKDKSGEVKVLAGADLLTLAELVPSLNGATLTGRLTSDLTLTGSGSDWEPNGSLTIANGEFAHPSVPSPLTGLVASIGFRNGAAEIDEARGNWMNGQVAVKGRAPFSLFLNPNQPSPQPFELAAEFTALKFDAVPALAAQNIGGEVSFRLKVSGNTFEPRNWQGTLSASSFSFRASQGLFEQKTPLNLTLKDSLVNLEPFTLAGPESTLSASGSLSLENPNPLALRVSGSVNAAVVQLFTEEVRADGDSKVELAVTGTLDRPRLRGTIAFAGLQGEIPSVQAVLEDVNGKVVLDGQHVDFAGITGVLNGGAMKLDGSLDLDGRAAGNLNARIEAKGTAWSIPDGLDTAADLDLRVAGGQRGYRASGTIRILDGSYRESLVIERGLFRTLSASTAPAADPLDQTRRPVDLDIKVESVQPLVVENELLNGEVTANLRVTGSTDRPVLVGRLDIAEGANFYLGGRNYLIDRGAVTFSNQNRIEPTLDVRGHTRAGGYDIALEVRGTVGDKLETSFTSDPPLSEANILSVLVSGRRLQDIRGAENQIAQDQALSYLSGNLASTFSQQTNRALGFSLVRIDPGLIADEAEPTARLTLGQDITDRLGLVYSVNLRNSADQIWVGRFDLTKRFQTRVVRQPENTFRFQFQHDLEFGGVAPPESSKGERIASRIGSVQVRYGLQGADGGVARPIEEKKLQSRLGVKAGKPFDFIALRKGLEKVRKSLAEAGYPEAKIRPARDEKDGKVAVDVVIDPGPRVEFRFRGGVPRGARKKIREVWAQNTFDSLRTRQSSEVLRRELAKAGFPAAKVESFIERTEPGRKRVIFAATRGEKFNSIEIRVPGSTMENEVLAFLAKGRNEKVDAALHPERLKGRVEQFYQRRGFLDAAATMARVETNGAYRISVPVTEGKQVLIGEVTHRGNSALTARQFLDSARLYRNQYYDPAEIEEARTRVEEALAEIGLTGSEVKLEAARRGGAVDLNFQIVEGQKRVVAEVAVEGNQYVDQKLVRSQLGMKEGDVLTGAKLSEARRNLYATGAFSLVDVDVSDLSRMEGTAPSRITARLREVRPFEIRYGVLFDTERGPGGIFDVAARNVLGSARTAGIRGRYDSKLQEARAYFEQPSLLRLPMRFVTTGFVRREVNDAFLTDRTGGSALLEYRWKKPYLINFGYRFEQVHTFERNPDPLFPFDIRLRLAPLTAGFSRDTRDQILDATRGSFLSHIAEWAPSTLGSQLQFAKYFGQYFYYRTLGEPSVVPWSGETRSRLVYAGGVRYGIASGLGDQDLIPSERFYGGGSTTVRGFAQDRLGPIDGSSAVGGESMFVVNNELRFPIYRFVDGAAFVDTGNVFERWRDFRLDGLRFTSGAGLRLRTPYFLIRVDYGRVLNGRPGDPGGRFYFGIGQAF